MNELVQIVMQKTGLSQEKAQQAVDTVVRHLKDKLPAPIASHLDSFLSTGGGTGEGWGGADNAKSMTAGLGGISAKTKE